MRILLFLIVFAMFLTNGSGSCTPEAVKDDLNKCLQYQGLSSYFQFPIVPAASYRSLCSNSTCLAYCMQTTISTCQNEEHMNYLGDGFALKTAFLGFCDQENNGTYKALLCAEAVSNQDALNPISAFLTNLTAYVTLGTENDAAICSSWQIMITALQALINTACSADTASITVWTTFLNTIIYPCDSTVSPSFYLSYQGTPVEQCAGAGAMTVLRILIGLCIILILSL